MSVFPGEYYEPLPDFLPCRSHVCEAADFDFSNLNLDLCARVKVTPVKERP